MKIRQTKLKKKQDYIQFFFNAPQFVILPVLVIPSLHKNSFVFHNKHYMPIRNPTVFRVWLACLVPQASLLSLFLIFPPHSPFFKNTANSFVYFIDIVESCYAFLFNDLRSTRRTASDKSVC